jgi:hypothetical protein
MHPANAASTQCPIGKETGDQEQEGIAGQKIVRERIDLPERDHDPDESDDRQTNTDHGGGDGEDMNTDIFFEMVFLIRLWHGAVPDVS